MTHSPAWTAEARALGTCVLAVKQPIPELGALAGDEIVIRPEDPEFPVVLRRTFSLNVLRVLAELPVPAVAVLYHEPSSDRPPLTLVR